VRSYLPIALALIMGTAFGAHAATTAAAGDAKLYPPLQAILRVRDSNQDVTIIGRTEGELLLVEGSNVHGARKKIAVDAIERAHFRFKIEQGELRKHVMARQWNAAVRLLVKPLQVTLPYLDVPENNAADLVIAAGDYMMRAADVSRRAATTDEDRETVKKQYEAAYAILSYPTKADWYSGADIARLKRMKCLLELSKPKTAHHYFGQLREPVPGDRAYGLYWLVKAEMDYGKKAFRAAMDAAVKSLAFENKDVDTFPDALILSAACYEELQEWHRARDVYYEVACIFPGSDWADAAVSRLHFIMDRELTSGEDKTPIENVFFGLNEDMDQKVRDLFEKIEEQERGDHARPPRKLRDDDTEPVEEINLDDSDIIIDLDG